MMNFPYLVKKLFSEYKKMRDAWTVADSKLHLTSRIIDFVFINIDHSAISLRVLFNKASHQNITGKYH